MSRDFDKEYVSEFLSTDNPAEERIKDIAETMNSYDDAW